MTTPTTAVRAVPADGHEPPRLTPQPTITPTTVVCRAVVEGTSGSGIYLRDAPQGNELVILAEGTLLTVLDDAPVEAGGFIWRKVREVGGEEGWAAEDFLTIRAPCGSDKMAK
ncbi:MAG: SH3 domain-containing protein [Chitinophagaceae bacterium]